jgi:integrase
LKANLERAGLPRIRFHDLRHTAATLMLGAGVPIPTASHILGHANATETLNRYAHVLLDMHEAAAERIDSLGF